MSISTATSGETRKDNWETISKIEVHVPSFFSNSNLYQKNIWSSILLLFSFTFEMEKHNLLTFTLQIRPILNLMKRLNWKKNEKVLLPLPTFLRYFVQRIYPPLSFSIFIPWFEFAQGITRSCWSLQQSIKKLISDIWFKTSNFFPSLFSIILTEKFCLGYRN